MRFRGTLRLHGAMYGFLVVTGRACEHGWAMPSRSRDQLLRLTRCMHLSILFDCHDRGFLLLFSFFSL